MQKILTCLGFNDQAEEAVNFYTSVIKDSEILTTTRFGAGGPGPKGSLIAASFMLHGQEFLALNGGPSFKFTTGMSILIKCDTQAEIDSLWNQLSEGGAPGPCGWLTDRFGVSWQIVPTVLSKLMNDPDPRKAQAAMNAMLSMTKLDIALLEAARDSA